MKTFPDTIARFLTTKRKFNNNGKIVEKEFVPVLQNVDEQEVLYIYEMVRQKYGNTFTIDLIKHIPEEAFIYFRGTFFFPEYEYEGKGTIYLDDTTYEILFDNLTRLLHRKGASFIMKFEKQKRS